MLAGAQAPNEQNIWSLEDSLRELGFLATTAGMKPVGTLSQKLRQVNPAYYLGKGKVEELIDLRRRLGYDVVVVDDELSPSQLRNLENAVNVPVIDRTALILIIFAQRAQTREGQLQVALAQYEYLLPRLTGQWTHLERQTGESATRGGMGETQLEVDRRKVRERIADLKRRLERVREHRAQYRKRRARSGIPVVALVGYTNAGKSTLFNRLTAAGVLAEDKLFATLDPTTRCVRLPGGRVVLLSDTVGFIQKLPTSVVAAFRATLEELSQADVLLHVLDVTHPQAFEQGRAVSEVLEELELDDKPVITVLNKTDRIVSQDITANGAVEPEEEGLRQTLMDLSRVYPRGVPVSAVRGWGIERLLSEVETVLQENWVHVSVDIPYGEERLVDLFHKRGNIERETFEAHGTHLDGRLPVHIAERFRPYERVNGRTRASSRR